MFQRKSHLVILLCLTLLACAAQPTIEVTQTITETSLPTATATSTSTPTQVPTQTSTPVPTETTVPLPVSLTGAVLLSSDSVRPFVSKVELREKDTFETIKGTATDSLGKYALNAVLPGTYELWVLITNKPTAPSGCNDIQPPDLTWLIGMEFEGDKALTIENAYLSKALLLNEGLQGSGLKAVGFYAVLSGFEVKAGTENQFDVVLICS